jgi:hypothetical protein
MDLTGRGDRTPRRKRIRLATETRRQILGEDRAIFASILGRS